MEKQGQVGIYKLYKLGRLSGIEFSKEIKVLDRDLHVVHHDYAERINEHANISGLWYEYDSKASKLYWDKKPFKNVKEFVEFEEVADENLDALKAEYLLLSGKKAHHLWGEVKLIEKIEELKK